MDLIRLAIRQPVTITVGVILIILAGVVALSRLPIQLTPNVEDTIVTVTTFWEGASPEEIEQNVVDKQEERLQGLANLRLMTSTSNQSMGRIRLQFATGTDKNVALREVSDKLREVPDYPEFVDEPVIQASDPENRDFIAWFMLQTSDPEFDIRTLRDFAVDRIEPLLENVEGVAEINVLGGREREVHLRVDAVRLAQYGITPSRFAAAIRGTNQNISAGLLADGKLDVRLRTIGRYGSLEEIERTILADTDAGPVRVQDVAEATRGFKEPTSFVRSKGHPVIAINAEREIGSNIMEVMAGLKDRVAHLNAPGGMLETEARRLGLDGDLSITQVYDQTIYIDDALALVRNNIFIGGSLAAIVLIIFLRSLRTVGIIALAIPISVIGAVVAMVAMHRSMNVISLAGMAFAVGMVVDNAIVVLENIFRHLEMGKPPMEAAYDGTREVWGAVLASTLTTIVVFIPILLIAAEAGQLFRDIALAICAAVGLSLLVSITVIPAAASRLLRPDRVASSARGAAPRRGALSRLIARLVYALCGSTIARLAVVVALTGLSIAGSMLLMPPADYLPHGNRNLVFGLIVPPTGYNIDQLDAMGQRVEEEIRPFWEVTRFKDDAQAYEAALQKLPSVPTFNWMTQQPGPPIVPPPLSNYFFVAFEGIMFHGGISEDPEKAVDLIPLFSNATRPEITPGVIAFPFQVPLFQLGGSTGSAVKVQLAGPDLDEVVRAATVVYQSLGDRYGYGTIQPVPANFSIPSAEIQVVPDLVRLSEVGLTVQDVGLAVQMGGDGAMIGEYRVGGESIDLKVIASRPSDGGMLGALEDMPLATPSGHVAALGSIAAVRRINSPHKITRVGRMRAVSFQLTPPPGVALEHVIDDLGQMIADFRDRGVIPPSIDTSLAGSASKLEEVRAALLGDGTFVGTISSSLLLALLVVYLLMCVLFQSFLKPLVIMFSVPLATLGGFAALFGVFIWSAMDRYMPMQMLDVLTMLGFVLLIGVVVNNAILIVHQTLNFLTGRAVIHDGRTGEVTARRAIAEAVRTRTRPIFMSMLTSVGAMLPLVLMPGPGSELYRGLGSVVVGGLLLSTVFTLLLVPLLLSLVMDLGRTAPVLQAAPQPARTPAPQPAPGTTAAALRRSPHT